MSDFRNRRYPTCDCRRLHSTDPCDPPRTQARSLANQQQGFTVQSAHDDSLKAFFQYVTPPCSVENYGTIDPIAFVIIDSRCVFDVNPYIKPQKAQSLRESRLTLPEARSRIIVEAHGG